MHEMGKAPQGVMFGYSLGGSEAQISDRIPNILSEHFLDSYESNHSASQ
jgi:hypothetical protein